MIDPKELIGLSLHFDGGWHVIDDAAQGAMGTEFSALSQRDPRWADTLIGNSKTQKLGPVGCLTTSKAMLCRVDDVARMNTLLRQAGSYAGEPYGAYASSFDVEAVAPNVKLLWASARYPDVPAPPEVVQRYREHIGAGNPAIVEVNFYNRFKPSPVARVLPVLAEPRQTYVTFDDLYENMSRRSVAAVAPRLFSQHFVFADPDGTIHDPWPLPSDPKWPAECKLSPDYGPNLPTSIIRVILYRVTI